MTTNTNATDATLTYDNRTLGADETGAQYDQTTTIEVRGHRDDEDDHVFHGVECDHPAGGTGTFRLNMDGTVDLLDDDGTPKYEVGFNASVTEDEDDTEDDEDEERLVTDGGQDVDAEDEEPEYVTGTALKTLFDGDTITFDTHTPGLGSALDDPVTGEVTDTDTSPVSSTYIQLSGGPEDYDGPEWVTTVRVRAVREPDHDNPWDTGGIRWFELEQYDEQQISVTQTNTSHAGGIHHGYVTTLDYDDTDDDDEDVSLANVEEGDKLVDTVTDRVHEVTDIGNLYDNTVLYGSEEADTYEDFVEDVEDGRLVPVADTATETARRVLAAKDADTTDPVAAALSEPMNTDDRHLVRFVSTKEDGVDFDISTGLVEWFEPDRIIAEQYDIVDGVREALDVLRERADLRTVGSGRHGAFVIDPDTERVEEVKLYDSAFDLASHREGGGYDDVAAEMLDCIIDGRN